MNKRLREKIVEAAKSQRLRMHPEALAFLSAPKLKELGSGIDRLIKEATRGARQPLAIASELLPPLP